MRIESFNCGYQVSNSFQDIGHFLQKLSDLKLPVSIGYAKFPAHNPIFNAMIDMAGHACGWSSQPYVLTEIPRLTDMRGDLAKVMPDGTRVFVEVEIGNEASVFRDLVKFDVANKFETFDFFIFILPGAETAKKLGYAMSFDSFVKKREFFKQFISVPLIVVEIEPTEEFDLNSITTPEHLRGRWGMKESQSFIQRNNLANSLGLMIQNRGDL